MFLGYDTTANSIIYGAITLALYDKIQDQMVEEVDRIYKEAEQEGRTELDYVEDYPKFRYVVAFMVCALLTFDLWPSVLTRCRSTRSCESSPSLYT